MRDGWVCVCVCAAGSYGRLAAMGGWRGWCVVWLTWWLRMIARLPAANCSAIASSNSAASE
eukprot:3886578-Prymnesium_polylepis.1